MWTQRLAIGRRERDVASIARRLAVLALAIGQDHAVATVGRAAHDLEPAVGVATT